MVVGVGVVDGCIYCGGLMEEGGGMWRRHYSLVLRWVLGEEDGSTGRFDRGGFFYIKWEWAGLYGGLG